MRIPKNKARAFSTTILCLLAVGGAVSFAQRAATKTSGGRPEIKVSLSGSVERANQSIPAAEAGQVNPGEVVTWAINSQNEGSAPAHHYQVVGQIPRGTILLPDSTQAEAKAAVTYSIDGGKTFSSQPTIEQSQADGSIKRISAPVSMYTQIRYEWSDPLAAGGRLTASYQVRVK